MFDIKVSLRAVFLVVVLSFCGMAQAQVNDINDAINKSGSLRYAAHRLGKVYIQIGMGVDVDRSTRILDRQIATYDRRVVELKNYAPTPEIKATFLALEQAWIGYKDLLVGVTPSQDGARRIVEVSDEVVAIANHATGQLAAYSGSTQGGLVNLSGRQRMLSQRLAKHFQAAAWGVAPANVQTEIGKDKAEFMQKLDELAAAPINTPALNSELALGKQQWMFFEAALAASASDKKTSTLNVATTSERILEVMDNVVGMYEQLSK